MKKIFLLCLLTAVAATFLVWHAAAGPRRFGAFSSAPKAEVAQLIADPKTFLGKTVDVTGIVSEQCKTMGCFFFFRSGKQTLRVDLQEIAMKAPLNEGRAVRVEGQLVPWDGGYQLYATAVEFK
jgi:hypothetical protein